MQKKTSYLIPSLSHLFFIILLCILILRGDGLLLDGDTGFHIRTGDYILENFTVPKVDIFSYIYPPPDWTAHEWLAAVIMSIIHTGSGMNGVVIFYSLLIAGTFYWFLNLMNKEIDNILLVWTIVFFATACTMFHWLARPHVFSFLFLILFYYLLDKFKYKERKWIYFLPIIMLFWVNLHGGFVLGFVILFINLAGNFIEYARKKEKVYKEKIEMILIAIGLCAITCSINPIGYKIFLFPLKIFSNKFLMTHIQEFLATNFQNEVVFRYFFIFSFGFFLISKQNLNPTEFLMIIAFAYISLKSVRYTSFYAIIAAPILIKHLDYTLKAQNDKYSKRIIKSLKNINDFNKNAKGVAWIYCVIISVMVITHMGYLDWRFDPKKMPVDAVEFLKNEKIEGNMFNNDEFGDYLIYAAYPEYKVLFDGRSDMYGEEHFKKYMKVIRAEYGWEKVIEEFNIGWIFFDSKSFLSRYLKEREDWHLIYADKVAHIYVRKIEKYQHLIEKFSDIQPIAQDAESDS